VVHLEFGLFVDIFVLRFLRRENKTHKNKSFNNSGPLIQFHVSIICWDDSNENQRFVF
jgi:hypothetical protein